MNPLTVPPFAFISLTYWWWTTGVDTNRKLEEALEESVSKACFVDPQLIKLPQQPGQAAEVQEGAEVYTVQSAGTAQVTCTCSHSMRGNLCTHAAAVRPVLAPSPHQRKSSGRVPMQANMRMDPRLRYGLFIKHMPDYPTMEERAVYEAAAKLAAASARRAAPSAPQRRGAATASAPMPVRGPSSGSVQAPPSHLYHSTQPPARERPTPRMSPLDDMKQMWRDCGAQLEEAERRVPANDWRLKPPSSLLREALNSLRDLLKEQPRKRAALMPVNRDAPERTTTKRMHSCPESGQNRITQNNKPLCEGPPPENAYPRGAEEGAGRPSASRFPAQPLPARQAAQPVPVLQQAVSGQPEAQGRKAEPAEQAARQGQVRLS